MLKSLYLSQAYYVEKFLPTSEFLEKQGFYKRLADFIHNGDIIIDVGCGDGRLVRHLRNANQNSTIIGIDINPLMLMIGNDILTKLGHEVNMHYGIDIIRDPNTNRLSLISDIVTQKLPYKFEKGKINLLQEDFRFGDVLRERLEKDLTLADTIAYTLPGGFSPHIIFEIGINLLQEDFRFGDVLRERLEKDLTLADTIAYALPGGFSPHIIFEIGEKNYNSILAGIEMNEYVLALGVELLKDKGRMIWAMRVGSQSPEKAFNNVGLDELNLSKFKPYYDINKVEIIYTGDEQEQKLNLPAYTIDKGTVHYTNDIRTMKHNLKIAVLFIEMIKKGDIRFIK